jgi:hypothetical protein
MMNVSDPAKAKPTTSINQSPKSNPNSRLSLVIQHVPFSCAVANSAPFRSCAVLVPAAPRPLGRVGLGHIGSNELAAFASHSDLHRIEPGLTYSDDHLSNGRR